MNNELLFVLFLIGFLGLIYLLPDIPVDEDGNEVFDKEPPPPCDYHSWEKTPTGLRCQVCGRRS